jgi:phage shock protein C
MGMNGPPGPTKEGKIEMPFSDTNVFARDDTFFGVCQAIGEDLGFNPNYLRIAFALPLLYAPVTTLAVYAALAAVVVLLRLIVPNPRRAPSPQPEDAGDAVEAIPAGDDGLPLAA